VAGDGVHRLDLAAETLGVTRIHEHPSLGESEHVVHRKDVQNSRAGREITLVRRLLHVRMVVSGLHPGRPATVEHANIPMAGPAQEPPAPRRRATAPVVVHDDGEVVAHSSFAHGLLEDVHVRERVASPVTGWAGEGAVQVDVRRTRNVPAGELLLAGRPTQAVAHVEDDAPAGRHQGGELVDGDQRLCLHGMILPDG
jgi:hypothetical protein